MTDASTGGPPRHDGVIAIVDDDVSVRRALDRLLRSVGLRTLVRDSGREFLESAQLHDVSCLVLDVHMPGMSGPEVLDEVRVAASKLPVVLMTGRYEVDFAQRAIGVGATAFLRKPFTDEELFQALERATGQTLPR